jgi:predicted RNA-binding Zn-ribbon protein involved in translation (DUF1610 family)
MVEFQQKGEVHMALINAKCTACEADLEIDGTQEAAVCKYCGTAFIVEKAVHFYNISKIDETESSELHRVNLDDSFEELRDEYITRICNKLSIERKTRGNDNNFYNEVLEFIKISTHDYDRRCKEYWDMFYKAVFVVAFLLSLPYFVLIQPELNDHVYFVLVFPILSLIISIFACRSLPRIHDKNLKYNLRVRALTTYLSSAFVERDLPIITDRGEKYKNSLRHFRITRATMFLFVMLLILSIIEIIYLPLSMILL